MRTRTTLATMALALTSAVANGAQNVVVPPDVKRTILDLVYPIEDLAPAVAELAVKETDLELQIELPADVLFDFDKSDLKPEARAALDRAAGLIRARAQGTVRISGYTDAKGNDRYNQQLSDRRAESVRKYLAAVDGLHSMAFTSQGLGAKDPVAANTNPDGSDNPAGRQKNRRVEIVIRKKT